MQISDLENNELFTSMGVEINKPAPFNFEIRINGEKTEHIAYLTQSRNEVTIFSKGGAERCSFEKAKGRINDIITDYLFS